MMTMIMLFGSYSSYIYLSYSFVLGVLTLLAIISLRRRRRLGKMLSRLETTREKK